MENKIKKNRIIKENMKLSSFVIPEVKVIEIEKDEIITASGDGDDNTGGPKEVDCLAKGTKITLSDHSTRNIEDIKEEDELLCFDHELGRLVSSKVIYVFKGKEAKAPITLYFDNGVSISIIGEHDFFNKESNRYVTINKDNALDYVNKSFYSINDNRYVTLVKVSFDNDPVEFYEIYTEHTFNCVANGMLNVADDVDYLLNIYSFKDNLQADLNKLKEDINTYGLFLNNEQYGLNKDHYDRWNCKYIYLAVGKELITLEELKNQNEKYESERLEKTFIVSSNQNSLNKISK